MRLVPKYCFAVVLLGMFQQATAQLTSDAGIGQFGSFGNSQPLPTNVKGRFQSGFWYGSGQAGTSHFSLFNRLDLRLGDQFIVYVGLPVQYNLQDDFGGFLGVSNPSVAVGYELPLDLKAHFTLNAGIQFPGQNADLRGDGTPLPMLLQPSLGSTDLMLGVTFEWNQILFGLAFQRPLTGNKNRFVQEADTDSKILGNMASSYFQERGNDFALRFRHQIPLSKKLSVFYHLMPIVRLADDRYWDLGEGIWQDISQSKGMTVNSSFGLMLQPKTHYHLQIEAGLPLRYRNTHADGTLRYFFAGLIFRKDLIQVKRKYRYSEEPQSEASAM
jgi:hypothetical protein